MGHGRLVYCAGFQKKLTYRYAILWVRGLAARARGGEAAGLGAAKPRVLVRRSRGLFPDIKP